MPDNLPDARRAAIPHGLVNDVTAARIEALCRQQVATARKLLDRTATAHDAADHASVLDTLARDE